jgi:hypothetical protein
MEAPGNGRGLLCGRCSGHGAFRCAFLSRIVLLLSLSPLRRRCYTRALLAAVAAAMQPQYYPQPPPPQQQYNPQQGQPQFQGQQPQFYAAPPPQYGGQQPQYMPVQPQAARTWAGGLFGCCGARALAWGGGGQAAAFYPVHARGRAARVADAAAALAAAAGDPSSCCMTCWCPCIVWGCVARGARAQRGARLTPRTHHSRVAA